MSPISLPRILCATVRTRCACAAPLLAAFALSSDAVAQDWVQQVPAPRPTWARTHVRTALDVWVAGPVGLDGVAAHTSNGGTSFSESTFVSVPMRAVRFLAGPVGLVAGEGIQRTTDGGTTWTQVDGTAGLYDLDFPTSSTGFACGEDGRVLRTTDGGQSWRQVGIAGETQRLARVGFADALVGWAAGAGGALYRTSDGGASWTPQASGASVDLEGLSVVDGGTAWISGQGYVARTTDGGATWNATAFPAAPSASIFALTELLAFSAGADGRVRQTSDGGASWTTRLSAPGPLHDVAMADFFSGYAVGSDGRAYRSTDGGASWQLVAGGSSSSVPTFSGLAAVDGQRAWASSVSDGIFYTVDGGDTWTPSQVHPQMQVWDVAFASDGLVGVACGRKQGTFPANAWTHDGGQTWTMVSITANFALNTTAVASSTVAISAGYTHVMRTTSGGARERSRGSLV